MPAQEQLISRIESDEPRKADAIILLEGDGYNRVPHAAKLYIEGFAPVIVTVGNDLRREYGSFPSGELKQKLLESGVPETAIHCEEVAPHTKAEADRVMEIAGEKNWRTILIVTSPHHQYRAFLTFLQSMKNAGLSLVLINACASLSWEEDLSWGRRRDILDDELQKINEYVAKGDVASFEEGLEYLESRL